MTKSSNRKSSTQESIRSLLIISQVFGLLPTSIETSELFSVVNYINPVLQFTLVVASFYWGQYEIANFRATNLNSTIISVTILELILAVYSLLQAVTKVRIFFDLDFGVA